MNENPTNAEEQFALGINYWCGSGVPKDMEKAVYWYTKAAEQGYVKAQHELGTNYYNGQGVPQNFEKAVYWYTKAAEQGFAQAQYNLGVGYARGIGVPRDLEKAKYWLTKAAEQGDADAKEGLDKLKKAKKGGCYVATCVYGSYDCPEVWTLRRYRDSKLSASWFGRRFIQTYYTVSPKIVELFGNQRWFNGLWKSVLNKFIRKLQNSGIDNSPYKDIP